MKYFAKIKTLAELEERYRALAMEHHPDRNANSAASIAKMQKINAEYAQRKHAMETPPKKQPKRTEKPVAAQKEQEPIHTVDKKRFFSEDEAESIAKTAGKFVSVVLKSAALGLARRYNGN